MAEAYYDDASRPSRSFLDRLADKTPSALRNPAESLALAGDKAVTAFERAKTAAGPKIAPVVGHVRRNKIPYALGALAIGVGIGLLMHKPSRDKAAALTGKAWNGARNGLGHELSRELKSLFGR